MPTNHQLLPPRDTVAIDRPLIAFAFLAQTAPRSGDLLSGLAPIFKPIARNNVDKRFDPRDFSKQVRALYGIDIHPWAAEDLAPRLEKAGLLRREKLTDTTYQYLYAPITAEFNDVSEGDIRLVVQRFIEFATPILNVHGVPVDAKALEDGFFSQLIHMNFVAILRKPDRSKDDEKAATTLTIKKPPEQIALEEGRDAQARIDVLCASFIIDTYRNDKNLYELLVSIASGALVAEAVLNFKDPGGAVSLENMKIVIDAPFLMSYLDLSSEEARDYARVLCKTLQEHKAILAAFTHSAEELRDNLEGVMSMSETGDGFGPTARRLSSPTFHAYAHAVKTDPEAALKERGINLIRPLTSDASHQYISQEAETAFRNSLGMYQNPVAQTRDAASVAAVVRLRSGKRVRMTHFQNTDYIFITENPHLSESAFKFLVSKKLLNHDEVPAVLTDRYFAGLLLVLFGGKAEDVTRYRLLANCAAALEARNDVIRKMHRFLTEMDSHQADRFRALMTVERAGQHLMQLTLGDSFLVTNDNVPKILEEVEKVLVEKERKQFEGQLSTIEQQHKTKLDEIAERHERALREEAESRGTLAAALLEANAQAAEAVSQSRVAQADVRRLTEEVAQARKAAIESKRRQVERAAKFAKQVESFAHDGIAVLLGLVISLLTYFGASASGTNVALPIAIGTGLLATVAFWKIPERFFGPIVHKVRDWAFRMQIRKYGLHDELAQFEIDWENPLVRTLETRP